MDEELRGFDIQLFGDVFANLDQVLAALTTGTGFRFVAMFDARQMIRQGLTASTRAFRFDHGGTRLNISKLFNFSFDSRKISVPVFFKDIPL